MNLTQLSKLGLTEAEALIYHSMLKLGVCTVKDIAKQCGFHRTNIYDILEQLKEKGLVTYFKEGKSTKYNASDPDKLYDLIAEKKDILDNIFPELDKMHKLLSDKVEVEVFKGIEGLKSAFKDVIKEKNIVYAFGVSGQMRKYMPTFSRQWIRDSIAKKIHHKYIYITGTEFIHPLWEVRTLSTEYITPATATQIYGDKVLISVWEPTPISIRIKSKIVAKAYKTNFDILWSIAKKSTRKKSAF